MGWWWRELVAEAAPNVHLLADPWEQEFVAGLLEQVGIALDQRQILNDLVIRMRGAAGYHRCRRCWGPTRRRIRQRSRLGGGPRHERRARGHLRPADTSGRIQQAKKPHSQSQFFQIVAKPSRVVRKVEAKPEPKLTRVAFVSARLMEFCSKRELQNQTGHSVYDWPLVVAKELFDNALDACEEAEAAPDITVIVEQDKIIVQDNANGIDATTMSRFLTTPSGCRAVRLTSHRPAVRRATR